MDRSLTFLLIVFLFGCGKEFSHEGGTRVDDPATSNAVISTWEFKEASTLYKGPVDTAFLTKETGKQILTITGQTTNGKQRISIIVSNTGPISKGTYVTSQLQVKFFFFDSSDTLYMARPYTGGDIAVTITEFDDLHVVGNFRGIALDRSTNSKDIIDGRFSSPLKKSGPANATGSVVLWASESCNGPIKVKVNDIKGEITSFPYITPECGEPGSASFTFKPGDYRWVAYCGNDSISGKINVRPDSCSKLKLEFPFKPAAATNTQGNCKITGINATGEKNTSIVTEHAGKNIAAVTFPVNVYGGFVLPIRHPYEKIADTVTFLGDQHKFAIGPAGNVDMYIGLLRADEWQSQPVRSKYSYGSGGQLTSVHVVKADGTPMRNVALTWSNGNLERIKVDHLLSGSSDEWVFDYYFDKTIKAFPFIFTDIPEMFFFQTALDFGPSSRNAIKTMRLKSYAPNGRIMSDLTWAFERYIIDANNYIQEVSVHRTDWWNDITHYRFTYNCD